MSSTVYRLTAQQAAQVAGSGVSAQQVQTAVGMHVARCERDKLGVRGFVSGVAESRVIGAALVAAGLVRDYGVWSRRVQMWGAIHDLSAG